MSSCIPIIPGRCFFSSRRRFPWYPHSSMRSDLFSFSPPCALFSDRAFESFLETGRRAFFFFQIVFPFPIPPSHPPLFFVLDEEKRGTSLHAFRLSFFLPPSHFSGVLVKTASGFSFSKSPPPLGFFLPSDAGSHVDNELRLVVSFSDQFFLLIRCVVDFPLRLLSIFTDSSVSFPWKAAYVFLRPNPVDGSSLIVVRRPDCFSRPRQPAFFHTSAPLLASRPPFCKKC